MRGHHLIAEFDRALCIWRAEKRCGADDQAFGLVDEQPQAPATGIGRRGGAQGRIGGVVEALGEGWQFGCQVDIGKIAVQQTARQLTGTLAIADQRAGERAVDWL